MDKNFDKKTSDPTPEEISRSIYYIRMNESFKNFQQSNDFHTFLKDINFFITNEPNKNLIEYTLSPMIQIVLQISSKANFNQEDTILIFNILDQFLKITMNFNYDDFINFFFTIISIPESSEIVKNHTNILEKIFSNENFFSYFVEQQQTSIFFENTFINFKSVEFCILFRHLICEISPLVIRQKINLSKILSFLSNSIPQEIQVEYSIVLSKLISIIQKNRLFLNNHQTFFHFSNCIQSASSEIVKNCFNELKEPENLAKSSEDTESLKQEVKLLRQKTQKQEELIQEKERENRKQADDIELLKSLLSLNKEKPATLQIVDYKDYEVESVIGEGGTSSVKIVTKKEKYAQKELKEITFEQAKRILSECEILIVLLHPCIIRVFGFSHGDDTHPPSIILSLESTSLEKAIKDKELNEEEKNRITVEVVLGMRYIHKKKFMHRDLKPSNILLSKKKHVRISDFGLAKEESLEMSQSKGVGTMRFMAPEIFEEKEEEDDDKNKSKTRYTNKVDVYSFGITLIYIVTEKYPAFSLKDVVTGVPPKMKGPIVDWVRELILRCLSLSPAERPSFTEIFEMISFVFFHD